jgi:hypothetical protein
MPKRELQPLRIGYALTARRQGRVPGRKRQIANNKIEAAKEPLASGTPSREVGASQAGPSLVIIFPDR